MYMWYKKRTGKFCHKIFELTHGNIIWWTKLKNEIPTILH